MIIWSIIILLLVLTLPFFVKRVEEELEIFFFIMGIAAVSFTGQWSSDLIKQALAEPVKITAAVFIAGVLFKALQKSIAKNINKILDKIGIKLFAFFLVAGLGLASSVITVIVAALILVEIISHLKLDKKDETRLVVLSCFSMGIGSALTPIGEPLATIITSKLQGQPYHAGFWFLFKNMWFYIIPCILFLAGLAVKMTEKSSKSSGGLKESREEEINDIFIRTGKIYLFIVSLVFLGTGFKPVIDNYISKIPYYFIYWINLVSAILNNSTLAAAEIGPSMSLNQVIAATLALITAGGMLVSGNIPNIIAANKLKIRNKDWAMLGVPLGLGIMVVYFIVILSQTGQR
jgi:predicted cation transporter